MFGILKLKDIITTIRLALHLALFDLVGHGADRVAVVLSSS